MKFNAQEKQLFLSIVRQCLENRPGKRPSSVMLVQKLKHIESAKEEKGRQKDEVSRQKSATIQAQQSKILLYFVYVSMVMVTD